MVPTTTPPSRTWSSIGAVIESQPAPALADSAAVKFVVEPALTRTVRVTVEPPFETVTSCDPGVTDATTGVVPMARPSIVTRAPGGSLVTSIALGADTTVDGGGAVTGAGDVGAGGD